MDPVSLLLVGGLVLILVMQFSRVRKQQRAVKETQAGLEVGAEVLTAAGMVATVTAVGEATITLRGPDGHLSRWVKGAVVRVLPQTDPASMRYEPPADAAPADAAPTDVAATDAAPTDAAPTDAAPTGTAPTGTAPTGTAPTGTAAGTDPAATTEAVDDDGRPRHQD